MEATQVTQSLDYVSLATNLGIFLGLVVAAILGLKKGLKLFDKPDRALPNEPSRVIAASIIESQTILHWTESNRSLLAALTSLEAEIVKNTEAMYSTRNGVSTATTELAHQIELLRVQLK